MRTAPQISYERRDSSPRLFPRVMADTGMLTAKGKYGLKALVHLARLAPGETTSAVDIADSNTIPKKFLDAILRDLRNAGIVQSKKGPGGGYALAKPSREIRVGTIIRVLDGPLAPIPCASRTAYQPCPDCDDVRTCAVRFTMTKVRDAMAEILDSLTLADMLSRSLSLKKLTLPVRRGTP